MTTETLMTEAAATTTEGTAASEPTAQQAATAAAEGGQQQATTEQTTDGQQAEGAKPAAETEDKPQGAPEAYEFKAPEGAAFDEAVIGAFSEVAKELDLPQDAAQKVLDKMAPVIQARQAEQLSAAREEWAAATRADKEIGGDKLAENLALAKKARDQFTTPEFRELLEASGLGNHPEVIRVFVKVGKATSEDGFVAGGGKTTPTDARRLYSASNMNP